MPVIYEANTSPKEGTIEIDKAVRQVYSPKAEVIEPTIQQKLSPEGKFDSPPQPKGQSQKQDLGKDQSVPPKLNSHLRDKILSSPLLKTSFERKLLGKTSETLTNQLRQFYQRLPSKYRSSTDTKIAATAERIRPLIIKAGVGIGRRLRSGLGWLNRYRVKYQPQVVAQLKKLFHNPKTLLMASNICFVLFFVGLVYFFGPVVQAEASYQMKKGIEAIGFKEGNLKSFFIPAFDLTPKAKASDFGIVIPKISVNETVIANVDPTDAKVYLPALKQGIAHAAGSGLPGDGQQGYYFAHSSEASLQASRLNAVFYLLGKLEPDDVVYLWYQGEKYTYKVVGKEVVEARDVSFLKPQSTKEQIVLQTCWPLGTSLKRLIVRAERA